MTKHKYKQKLYKLKYKLPAKPHSAMISLILTNFSDILDIFNKIFRLKPINNV